MKLIVSILSIAVLVLAVAFVVTLKPVVESPFGSVARGGEYQKVHTNATTTFANQITTESGTLGSIIIDATYPVGRVFLRSATTTNSNLRTTTATSSLPLIAIIEPSQPAGTYVYDVQFTGGLIAVYEGVQGTSTITWRP